MTTRISILFCMVIMYSCTDTKNNSMIVGTWNGAAWLVDGKPSANDVVHTSFTFDSTGTYTYMNAGNKETGTYKIENDQLFTTPANEREMMVKIMKLTTDSLVFQMNRGGQPEELTLIKKP